MSKSFKHGYYGSSAITNAVQRVIDTLIKSEPQPVFTFVFANPQNFEHDDFAALSFGLVEESDGVLRWRINKDDSGKAGPAGLHSETIYSHDNSYDADDYQRHGLAAACELSSYMHDLKEYWKGSEIFLTNIQE